MSIKVLAELRIPRPPTDICAPQDRLYVATKGKRVFFAAGGLEGVKSILFSSQVTALSASESVLYCGCEDGTIYGLSPAHKTVFKVAVGPTEITSMLYHKTRSDIFAGAHNRKIVQLGENSIVKNTFYGYDSPVASFDVSANGTLASASQNNQNIKVVNANTKDPKHLRLPCGFSESVKFLSNDYLLVGTLSGQLHVYRTRSLELADTVSVPAGICAMHLHQDGTLLLGLVNATIVVCRLCKAHPEPTETIQAGGIPVAFSTYRGSVAVAVSREKRMGRWNRTRGGKNKIILLSIG